VFRVNRILNRLSKIDHSMASASNKNNRLPKIKLCEPFHEEEYIEKGILFGWHEHHYRKVVPENIVVTEADTAGPSGKRLSSDSIAHAMDARHSVQTITSSTMERPHSPPPLSDGEEEDGEEDYKPEYPEYQSLLTDDDFPQESEENVEKDDEIDPDDVRKASMATDASGEEEKLTRPSFWQAAPPAEEEEFIESSLIPNSLRMKLKEDAKRRKSSDCDIVELIRRGSLPHIKRHYGIKEDQDLGKLWQSKRSVLIDKLYESNSEPEEDEANSLFQYANDVLDTFKREQIVADGFSKKYLRNIQQ